MKRSTNKSVIIAAAALALTLASGLSAATFDLNWFTVDNGGGTSTGGSFTLSGTIAQPDAGAMTGGGFELAGGFWPGVAGPGLPLPGDCDGDGDVDDADYVEFDACLAGPDGGIPTGCDCFDLDDDGSVSAADFAVFQVNFTGI